MNLSLQQQRRARITTLTYSFCDPHTDAECTAAWTGPFEAALARGAEVLDATRCDDGRYAWYTQETGEAYLSTPETVAELGAAHIDFGLYGETTSASLCSLWCAGDFDSEPVDHDRIRALQIEAGEHADYDLVETCERALDGDGAAYVEAAVLIVEAEQERAHGC